VALQQVLQQWFSTSPGSELLHLEQECIARLQGNLFGHYLVGAGYGALISPSRVRTAVLLGEGERRPGVLQVRGALTQMPLQSDAVDVVVLAHALDFTVDPHQVLREVERILIAEGRLILLGFNPYSLWGVRRLLRIPRRVLPWSGAFISQRRVVDWLRLLGFEIERVERLMYRPPLRTSGGMRGIGFIEAMGARWWPPLAAVYVIQAVKRVSTLTLIQPPWKLNRVIKPSLVEPSARNRVEREAKGEERGAMNDE